MGPFPLPGDHRPRPSPTHPLERRRSSSASNKRRFRRSSAASDARQDRSMPQSGTAMRPLARSHFEAFSAVYPTATPLFSASALGDGPFCAAGAARHSRAHLSAPRRHPAAPSCDPLARSRFEPFRAVRRPATPLFSATAPGDGPFCVLGAARRSRAHLHPCARGSKLNFS